MAGYNINVGSDLLPELLSGQKGLAKHVKAVLSQIMEAQEANTFLGYRSDKRRD